MNRKGNSERSAAQCRWLVVVICLALLPAQAFHRRAVGLTIDPTFTLAAAENARLRQDMNWYFGGRKQRGWYLYEALVAQLTGSDRPADSPEFAAALAQWQQRVGLAPTGVLNQETWMEMVSVFQARRIRNKSVAAPETLIQVAPSEFYDPARPDELRYVERSAWAAYQRMVAAAAAELSDVSHKTDYLKIISSYRSPTYQAQLRRQSPKAGRAGLALSSPHFTGRALDLYVGGEPVSTRDDNRALQVNTPAYRWLVRNAHRFGFVPYFYEPWHWEYCPRN